MHMHSACTPSACDGASVVSGCALCLLAFGKVDTALVKLQQLQMFRHHSTHNCIVVSHKHIAVLGCSTLPVSEKERKMRDQNRSPSGFSPLSSNAELDLGNEARGLGCVPPNIVSSTAGTSLSVGTKMSGTSGCGTSGPTKME